MERKIAFTILATLMTSVASAVAYKAAVSLWKAATGEHPPETGLAARFALKGPLQKRIFRLLQTS